MRLKKSKLNEWFLKIFNEYEYNDYSEIKPKQMIIANVFKIIAIMSLSTIITLIFRKIGIHESNVIIVYILGVLFVSISTDGYIYGTMASIIGVLSFNFFFTVPYYSFLAYRADYPVTFIIMLIAAIITSTLTSRVKTQVRISFIRENRMKILYKINKSLLTARNKKQVVEFCGDNLVDMFNRTIMIAILDDKNNLQKPSDYMVNGEYGRNIFKSDVEVLAIEKCFKTGQSVGVEADISINSVGYYHPIKGQNKILGIIGIVCLEEDTLSKNEKILLESVSTQIALAIEREDLYQKKKNINLEAERERVRGNLLRSISHDLRTPLTGILGSVSTITDNYDILDNDIKKELLDIIYEDTSWLIHSVENILSMTRIDEGKLEIKKDAEVVEEIVAESISRVKRFSGSHNIVTDLPQDMVILFVDGLLIEQVLINLIDNAIKYTQDDSIITVKVTVKEDNVVFDISDNGKGIPEEDITSIFDRFYTKTKGDCLEKRGIGLGLAICKSIIEAHGGCMEALNNSSGGATFRFSLPGIRSDENGYKAFDFNS
ncbi:sensor histidine kinase [Clostridium tagluense]|uniref:histidine kinase n=1 Tax=Clostridium tagluense TaxID=360422 RepID=A0A401URY2_9CLOT|nr:sensor histidine kinase [Clostridium tagluense]